jgi:hypothetical protein
MDSLQKVRENRLRHAAARQGLRLTRPRIRDPRSLGYGTYLLTDEASGETVMKPADGEDHTGEWDVAQKRPSTRALAQRAARQRLTLSDVEAILAAAPRRG